ncbi:MAG: amidohydrolase family protein [Pirellulales bacterium]
MNTTPQDQPDRVTRRQFVVGAAGAASAAALSGTLVEQRGRTAEPAPKLLPIVDTHQHMWDLVKVSPPWLKSAGQLNRSFVTKDYLEASRGQNIVQAVYMEVDVAPAQKTAEAEHIIELCRRRETPTRAAVIGGNPADDGFAAYIRRFKGNPYVKGVRQVLHGGPAGVCLAEKFVQGVRLLGELGMCFDLCLRPGELADGVKLVDQCPGTRFVLDHCGNADCKVSRQASRLDQSEATVAARRARDQWRRDIAALAKRKNVICKISGIVASATKGDWTAGDLAPIVNHCLDEFGPDRVVFGGDWPVCTQVASLGQWVGALREVIRPRSEQDQRKLLHDNAVRFYGLDKTG